MPIVDQHGNKLPQPRIRKKDASRQVRILRIQNKCSKHCMTCGFRVRGVNHKAGIHRQDGVKG